MTSSSEPVGESPPPAPGSGGSPAATDESAVSQEATAPAAEPVICPPVHPAAEADSGSPVPLADVTSPVPAADVSSPMPASGAGSTGGFEPFTIGDPGRAFDRTVPVPHTRHPDSHDVVIDAVTISDPDGTARLALRAASSRGLAHQHYGDPRQDDHCFTLTDDGEYLVAVVADGVSAGEWSHLAARVATEEGCRHVADLLRTSTPEDLPWHGVLTLLAEQLRDLCATLPGHEALIDPQMREVAALMATTLIVGVVATRPDAEDEHAVTVVRLGDTSGWILHPDDGWVALGEVKNAGNVIAESATACLPLVPESDPLVVQTTIPQGAALLLLTDGVGDPLGGGHGEVGEVLGQWWRHPPHPIEFAAQVGFGRKTFDDDRGALGVWPVPGQ